MSFLQPVLGSRGLIQYAWYTQFGYPGSLKPRSDPQVAARLLDLSKLSQQLRAFADHAFLRKRTSIEVVDAPTAPDGTELVHAAHFADKQVDDRVNGEVNAGTLLVVNGSNEPVQVGVLLGDDKLEVKLEAWGVVSCAGKQCVPI